MWSRASKGQIATMLTLFIGLLLVLAMVTVNVGKVAMTRTHTSNAGDAGTLAAGSFIASGDNAIESINTQMKIAYDGWFAIHFACGSASPYCIPYPDYSTGRNLQLAFTAAQLAQWGSAIATGESAASAANDALLRFAYLNGGIDDPHPDAFANLLKAKTGKLPNTYVWTDAQWSASESKTKEVENRFEIITGGVPTPFPLPPVPIFNEFGYCAIWGTSPVGPWTCCCICTPTACFPYPATPQTWFVPGSMPAIIDGNGTADATIRRVEPDANLRLWNMRYRDPASTTSDQDGLISKSRASYGGGSLTPCPIFPCSAFVDDPYDDVHLVDQGGG